MNKIKQRIKKKPLLVSIIVFLALFFISNTCLIYSILKIANIENLVRYLISSLLVLIFILIALECYKLIFKAKNFLIIIFMILLIGLFIGESYACGIINGFYNSINNIYKNSYTYSTSLISLSDNNVSKIKDVKSSKIGMIDDSNSIDGYQIATDIISEYNLDKSNEIVKYETVGEVIKALYDKEISYALVTSTYVSMFVNSDGYQNIKTDTKTIFTKTKTTKKDSDLSNINETDPFTILVMGIDSTEDDISKITSFNADSLMLITFNPNTYNATILSIPRDTYTTIACLSSKPKSKVTHSGWYGESCVVKTVKELMGVNIDYYAKINFNGVVSLVDAVDGIEVNVPYSLCEQNSNREWGSKTVYIKKGLQVLDGEQALALSRNRHSPGDGTDVGGVMTQYCPTYTEGNRNDFTRGQNQQLVINALINKIAKTTDINKLYSLIDILGNNLDTNMNTDRILSYYNLAKKIALNSNGNVITFERLYLSTYGKYIYDSLMKLPLSDQIYYNDSLKKITDEMKINLGIIDPTLIKEFTFSINKTYTPTIIGKGTYAQTDIETMPSFKGKDKAEAEAWATAKGITLNIEYTDVTEGVNNTVLTQSIPYSSVLSDISFTELNITVANVVVTEENNTETTE